VYLYIESVKMPRKIRELIHDLREAGFYEIPGGGKGAHRKFTHARYAGAVTLSGQTGDDAKQYQERQVRQAIERVKQ
jgi:predicted RNA binding protein YcfA (HicA-like mRNA interferase family)